MPIRKIDRLRGLFDDDTHKTLEYRMKMRMRMRRKPKPDTIDIMKIVMTVISMGIALLVGLVVLDAVRKQIDTLEYNTTEDIIPVNEYDEYPIPDESQTLNIDDGNIEIETANETIAKYKISNHDKLDILNMDMDFEVI